MRTLFGPSVLSSPYSLRAKKLGRKSEQIWGPAAAAGMQKNELAAFLAGSQAVPGPPVSPVSSGNRSATS